MESHLIIQHSVAIFLERADRAARANYTSTTCKCKWHEMFRRTRIPPDVGLRWREIYLETKFEMCVAWISFYSQCWWVFRNLRRGCNRPTDDRQTNLFVYPQQLWEQWITKHVTAWSWRQCLRPIAPSHLRQLTKGIVLHLHSDML